MIFSIFKIAKKTRQQTCGCNIIPRKQLNSWTEAHFTNSYANGTIVLTLWLRLANKSTQKIYSLRGTCGMQIDQTNRHKWPINRSLDYQP